MFWGGTPVPPDSISIPFILNDDEAEKWRNIPTLNRLRKRSYWHTCTVIHHISRLWKSLWLFWCTLSSRLNKAHIWFWLGFLRFYGCKTQPSNVVLTKCSCPENARMSLIADFSTLDLLKHFWAISFSAITQIPCGIVHKCGICAQRRAALGQRKDEKKYGGIQVVRVLGYCVTCLLFSLGAGKPPRCWRYTWRSSLELRWSHQSVLRHLFCEFRNIPADWQANKGKSVY